MKKRALLLPLLLVISSCSSNNQTDNPKKVEEEIEVDLTPSIYNENLIHYLGRTHKTNTGMLFAMTCSGFEFKIDVKEATNNVSATLNSYAEQGGPAQFAYVFIDGVQPEEKLALPNKTATYILAENLSIGTHYIRFVKLNEGAFTNITLKELSFNGMSWVRWDKVYEKKIEFMGDSITCGYGTDGVVTDPFSLEGENGVRTYAYTCANDLDYDFSFVSESGMSLCMNAWGNQTYFKDIYKTYDCYNSFDYQNYPIDIAVIALGTNDNTAFSQLSSQQQQIQVETIFDKYKELCDLIRSNNEDCQFFFVYNLMLIQNGYIDTAIKGTCIYLNDKYGDGTAYRYEFMPNGKGSGGHPNGDAQIADGHILSDFILNPYDID